MLVEDGGQGIQTLSKLGEAFLELDGLGLVHFRGGRGSLSSESHISR
jgi:hypothetical protein